MLISKIGMENEYTEVFSKNVAMVKAVITAGLYPNIVKVEPPKGGRGPGANEPKLVTKGGDVALHPCSILYQVPDLGSRLMIYHEKVKTSKVFIRDASAVQPLSLLLFGGTLEVFHQQGVITVDGSWLSFNAPVKCAVLIKYLRKQLDKLLRLKIQNPEDSVTDLGQRVINAISLLLEEERNAVQRKQEEIAQQNEH